MKPMLRLALISLLLALITAIVGVSGIWSEYLWVTKAVFLGFLVVFVVAAAVSAWRNEHT